MQVEIEEALSPLVGLPLWRAARAAGLLTLQFGERRATTTWRGEPAEVGAYALHVAAPWRLRQPARILVARDDLFVPGDPAADPTNVDREGATWWDQSWAAFFETCGGAFPVVASVAGDPVGGLRLALGRELLFEVFPDRSGAAHASGEFWRLLQPGRSAAHIVVGTQGLDRV